LLPGTFRAAGWTRVECLQIRLEPAAMLGEVSGLVVPPGEVWGRDAGRVEDRLRAAMSWDERFGIAAEILGRRPAARRVDPEVAHAWRRTLAAQGRLRVEGIADEVGWSRLRLWARFRSQLGITPKARGRAGALRPRGPPARGGAHAAGVAAESGYADQSHLHRETKALAGLTPTAVAAAPWLGIDHVAWPAAADHRRRVQSSNSAGVRTPSSSTAE
jgi:AraC-like DNA-binding protein